VKELGISEQTFHRWRNQYGGMKAVDAKRLKELDRENRQSSDRRRSGA
jgi:putative transposase